MRRPWPLAVALASMVLVACGGSGGTKTSDTAPGENLNDGSGSLFEPPQTPVTTPEDDGTVPPPPDDGTVQPPVRHFPPTWPAPRTAAESVAQLSHFWAEERFDWNEDWFPIQGNQQLEPQVLAKADVDECFNGIGVPSGTPVDGKCLEGKAKRNQSYVWGLTRTGRDIWFGTVANVLCQVILGWIVEDPNVTIENPYFVCENAKSASGTGDFRSPHLYRYNLDSKQLALLDTTLPADARRLLATTGGIRSAGEAGGVVFLAGLSAVAEAINVFAFDAETGNLIGAQPLPEYNDIRTWVKANDVLYAAVGNTSEETDAVACAASAVPCLEKPAGSILRWTGDKQNPFSFTVVGVTDNEAANMALHQGRLFVTTWPGFSDDISSARPVGLWASPPLGESGLTIADTGAWRELWSLAEYDPDPIARMTTAGGAIASFGGRLYWGTMSVPFLATAAAAELHAAGTINLDADNDGKLGADELLATALGTHRSVALFVLEGSVDSAPVGGEVAADCAPQYSIRLKYGEAFLPRYDPARRMYTIVADEYHSNVRGELPLRGSSGFGNFFNAYVWSMEVYKDALYIGTFDWAQVAHAMIAGLVDDQTGMTPEATTSTSSDDTRSKVKEAIELFVNHLGERVPHEGADLIRITEDLDITAETMTGLGNDTNYGVRTMVTDDEALFVGSANAMNIAERGGWELIELTPKPAPVAEASSEPLVAQ